MLNPDHKFRRITTLITIYQFTSIISYSFFKINISMQNLQIAVWEVKIIVRVVHTTYWIFVNCAKIQYKSEVAWKPILCYNDSIGNTDLMADPAFPDLPETGARGFAPRWFMNNSALPLLFLSEDDLQWVTKTTL